MKRQWLVPLVCTHTLFLFAGTALAAPQKSVPIPLRDDISYDAFLTELNSWLSREEFHIELSAPEYTAEISEDGFTAYLASTPSTTQVAFYTRDGLLYRAVTLYRPDNKEMTADATKLITAICLTNGLTPDEMMKLFQRQKVDDKTQLGHVYCKKTRKDIYTMSHRMDEHVVAVGVYALD